MTKRVGGSRKKVLVLATTFPRWTQDTVPPFVEELSVRLAEFHDVYVLLPFSEGSQQSEERDGLRISRFRYWPHGRLLSDGAILPNLKRHPWMILQVPFLFLGMFFGALSVLRRHKIERIHAHWIIIPGFVAVLLKVLWNPRLKILVTSHGADIFGLRRFNWLKGWICRRCSHGTGVSEAVSAGLRSLALNLSVTTLPMGVDTELFSPEKRREELREELCGGARFLLLFVGRLSEKKGLCYLFAAMPEILKRDSSVKLVVIGDGELREELEQQVEELRLTNHVLFLGALPKAELPGYFASADLFVGPSIVAKSGDMEGFGLVFAEAMASACVPVASDLPAVRDIIEHGRTGYLVSPRDHVKLAEIVIGALEGTDEEFKKGARESVVERFEWKVIAKRYGALFVGL
jgi:glycosyltransferase involved in cell wall biosynthesis